MSNLHQRLIGCVDAQQGSVACHQQVAATHHAAAWQKNANLPIEAVACLETAAPSHVPVQRHGGGALDQHRCQPTAAGKTFGDRQHGLWVRDRLVWSIPSGCGYSVDMYVQHFGLEHEPFSIAPDPRYLYMSERHREALAHLTYGLNSGGGIVLLTGEIGAGKTTVCRCFLDQVPADCRIAYIFNPKLTVTELLASVCEEFGVEVPHAHSQTTVKTYLDPLNHFLLDAHAAGRNSVLMIDEAQLLSPEVLEQLRLLTNLETSERKLLQIILIGQPELRDMLAQPGLEQLAQRVIARYHLGALDEADTGRYIAHRLQLAGLRGPSPLGAELLRSIHRNSGGIPRRINRLCDRALLGAYGQGLSAVDLPTLRRAAAEVEGKEPSRNPLRKHAATMGGWGRFAAGVAIGVLLFAAGLSWRNWDQPSTAVASATVRPDSTRTDASSTAPDAAPPSAASTTTADGRMASAADAQTPVTASPLAPPSLQTADAAEAPRAVAVGLNDLMRGLRAEPVDEQAAWRALGDHWGLSLGAGDACLAAAQLRLGCYKSRGGIALVRQLGRPGILTVQTRLAGKQHLLLVGIDSAHAMLLVGGQRRKLSLIDLASIWKGGFSTFWRVPEPLLQAAPADGSEPLAGWLSQRLAMIDGDKPRPDIRHIDNSLRERLLTFQRAQGLMADGLPGPMTLMALNRATGVVEPRLASDR